MTTSVILNSQQKETKNKILHQGNGSIRPNLGDRDIGPFVGVLAGVAVERESIVGAILAAHFGFAISKGGFALVTDVVSAATADTDSCIIQSLDNVL